jgi:class III poly(R)-hydroxyalkanoic acid synthase PhaE subunit
MSRNTSDPAADFQALAQQYWRAWSELAGQRDAMPSMPSMSSMGSMPGWKDGLAWWSKLAGSGSGSGAGGQVDAALERMNAQAGHWFGAMQQLAAGFAGREAGAADIAQRWRELLGAGGANPLADMFQRMGGADARGLESWMAQAAPYLGNLRGEMGSFLQTPAFGLAREHQERLQKLGRAQIEYQERNNDYNGMLAGAAQRAFELFESKLAERAEPGRQIESARALFDLWIDAAEEAWSELALTTEYRENYGRLVNALMQLRGGFQREAEVAVGLFGLPTRTELNASHRKLAALEREVRALKAQLAGTAPRAASAGSRAAGNSTPAAAKSSEVKPKPNPKPKAKAKPKPKPKPIAEAKSKSKSKPAAKRSPPRNSVMPRVVAPEAVGGRDARSTRPATRANRKGR